MSALRTPAGLGTGGRILWRKITESTQLDAAQEVTLLEACRAKDRLDHLDEVLRGDTDVWVRITESTRTGDVDLRIDAALGKANETANRLNVAYNVFTRLAIPVAALAVVNAKPEQPSIVISSVSGDVAAKVVRDRRGRFIKQDEATNDEEPSPRRSLT